MKIDAHEGIYFAHSNAVPSKKEKKTNLWWKPKIIIHFAGLLSGGQTTSVAL